MKPANQLRVLPVWGFLTVSSFRLPLCAPGERRDPRHHPHPHLGAQLSHPAAGWGGTPIHHTRKLTRPPQPPPPSLPEPLSPAARPRGRGRWRGARASPAEPAAFGRGRWRLVRALCGRGESGQHPRLGLGHLLLALLPVTGQRGSGREQQLRLPG